MPFFARYVKTHFKINAFNWLEFQILNSWIWPVSKKITKKNQLEFIAYACCVIQ